MNNNIMDTSPRPLFNVCRKLAVAGCVLLFCLALNLQASPNAGADTPREMFARAMSRFEALSKDKVRGMQREPWEKLEKEFQRIHAIRGQFSGEAFFYQARSREELADRSKKRSDYQEAIRLYSRMAQSWPNHALADNALYNQAMVFSGPLKDKKSAIKTLDQLILQYPSGDMIKEAAILRDRLENGGTRAAAGRTAASGTSAAGRLTQPAGQSAGQQSGRQTAQQPNYGVLNAPARTGQSAAATSTAAQAPAQSATTAAPAARSATAGAVTTQAQQNKQRELYQAAAATWKQLTTGNNQRSGHRDVWEALEKDFSKAVDAAPSGSYADKAMFQAARCREELAGRSKSAADWREAAARFEQTAKKYPKSNLADDSLYAQAVILADRLQAPDKAKQVCAAILERYPSGDMVQKTRTLAKKLSAATAGTAAAPAQGGKPAAQPAQTAQPTQPNQSAQSTQAAQADKPAQTAPAAQTASSGMQANSGSSGTKGIKAPASGATLSHLSWKGDASKFTLTIELAGNAKYRRNTLPPTDGGTARIQLDLLNTKLDAKVSKQLQYSGLPVLAVRSSQVDKNTSRVTIEVDNARSYKVSVLRNPYRLQVEVSAKSMLSGGHDLGKAAASAAGTANAPRVSNGTIVEQLGLSVKTIVVDAGHGGSDPGAIGNGITERTYTLELAKMLGQRLQKKGFTVIYTRSGNTYVALKDRTTFANDKKADIFISLHVNSSTNKKLSGLETYYLDTARSNVASVVAARENAVDVNATSDLQFILSDLTRNSKLEESKALAGLVQNSSLKQLQNGGFSVKDNGVRSAPFYVLMGARMPAFLVEVGYLSNSTDAKRLKNKKYMERLADGITDGIVGYRNKINSLKP